MNKPAKALLLATLSLVVLLTRTSAQIKTHYQYELGINAGTFLYQGDLISSPMGSFNTVKPMAQLYLAKEFSPYFSYRASLAIGAIGADESQFSTPAWKQVRNFAFSTPVTELSGAIVMNIYGDNGEDSYHTITPYLLAGAGISFLNIHRDWSRLNQTLAGGPKSPTVLGLGTDTLHALPSIVPVIPLGAGLKWAVTSNLSVNAEAVFRLSFSDYIDGFSYSANSKANDGYYGLSLGVSYRLGSGRVKCPRGVL